MCEFNCDSPILPLLGAGLLVAALSACSTTTASGDEVANLSDNPDAFYSLPLSARSCLAETLAEVSRAREQGADIDLHHIAAHWRPGRRDRPDHVQVRMKLTFSAESALVATNQFIEFKRSLERRDDCIQFECPVLLPEEDGMGIHVPSISLELVALDSGRDRAHRSESTLLDDPELYIMTGAFEGDGAIGQVRIDCSERPYARGVIDRLFRVEPGQAGAQFETWRVLAFASQLEEDQPLARVTALELRAGDSPEQWRFELVLTVRSATAEFVSQPPPTP